MFEVLIDNIFVMFGGRVFQHTVNILMGNDCAPFLTDLFLYSYEADSCDRSMVFSVSCDKSMVFSGSSVSSTDKTDRHDITEILLKVALNTIKQTNKQTA